MSGDEHPPSGRIQLLSRAVFGKLQAGLDARGMPPRWTFGEKRGAIGRYSGGSKAGHPRASKPCLRAAKRKVESRQGCAQPLRFHSVQSDLSSRHSRNVGSLSRGYQHIRCPGGVAIPVITEEEVVGTRMPEGAHLFVLSPYEATASPRYRPLPTELRGFHDYRYRHLGKSKICDQ